MTPEQHADAFIASSKLPFGSGNRQRLIAAFAAAAVLPEPEPESPHMVGDVPATPTEPVTPAPRRLWRK